MIKVMAISRSKTSWIIILVVLLAAIAVLLLMKEIQRGQRSSKGKNIVVSNGNEETEIGKSGVPSGEKASLPIIHSASRDFRAEAEKALMLGNSPPDYQPIKDIISAWLKEAPNAPSQWTQNLPEGIVRNNGLFFVTVVLIGKDPEEAARLVHPLLELPAWYERISYISIASEDKDIEATAKFLRLIPEVDRRYKQNLFVNPILRLATKWAKEDPENALKWVQELPDGKQRNKAIGSVARVWSEKNPEAATQWMQNLPEEGPRKKALCE